MTFSTLRSVIRYMGQLGSAQFNISVFFVLFRPSTGLTKGQYACIGVVVLPVLLALYNMYADYLRIGRERLRKFKSSRAIDK